VSDEQRHHLTFYNRDGYPIPLMEWAERMAKSEVRVALTWVGDLLVSTEWVGIDLGLGMIDGSQPHIFETLVLDGGTFKHPKAIGDWTGDLAFRYPNERLARIGHDHTVMVLRKRLAEANMPHDIEEEPAREQGQE
jgi:hypothetical protein